MSPINGVIRKISSEECSFKQYIRENQAELTARSAPLHPVYRYETASKISRVVRNIFKWVMAVIFPPYGFYHLLHWLGSKMIVPAQSEPYSPRLRKHLVKAMQGEPPETLYYDHNNFQNRFILHSALSAHQQTTANDQARIVAKRISLLVDGKIVDAMIVGKKENLTNKKWALISNGNGTTYEGLLAYDSATMVEQINQLGMNFLIYNYPGVAGSKGLVSRNSMVKSHRAMVRFLEDKERGMGAKTIVQVGGSIGGGVQGEALIGHKFLEDIKYVCLKYLTFSRISKVPQNCILRLLIKLFGWEFSSSKSSLLLEEQNKPEIIIQTASQLDQLDSSKIKGDGVISRRSSYAYHLLSAKASWKHKKFIGVNVKHWETPKERAERNLIITAIKDSLNRSYQGFQIDQAAIPEM